MKQLIVIFVLVSSSIYSQTAKPSSEKNKEESVRVSLEEVQKKTKVCELITNIPCDCKILSYNISYAIKGKALTIDQKGSSLPKDFFVGDLAKTKYFFEDIVAKCATKKKYIVIVE